MLSIKVYSMETLVFLCNGDREYHSGVGIINNSKLPRLIRTKISSGSYYITDWSCWNSKFIKVGDRAYLQRSGSEPSGFIAAGHVIAAPKNEQLKHWDSKYSDLSEAYAFDDEGCFFVFIQLDSVVDFDFPLRQSYLARLPQFRAVNFNFGRGGARFDAKAAPFLDAEWAKHSLIQQRQGRGRRLVDVFIERGDKYRQKKDYQAAINAYQSALNVDSKDSKSINRIKTCNFALGANTSIQAREASVTEEKKSSTNVIIAIDKPLGNRERLKKQSLLSCLQKLSLESGGAIDRIKISESILEKKTSAKAQETSATKGQDKFNNVARLLAAREEVDKQKLLAPLDKDEAQRRVLVSILRRQGQTKFRQILLEAYEYRCAITDFDAEAALEAAHIIPYTETENNDPSNGLLLRADLHTLFDLNLIAIHPETMEVSLCTALQETEYRVIHGKQIRIPRNEVLRPSQEFLRQRVKQCPWFSCI